MNAGLLSESRSIGKPHTGMICSYSFLTTIHVWLERPQPILKRYQSRLINICIINICIINGHIGLLFPQWSWFPSLFLVWFLVLLSRCPVLMTMLFAFTRWHLRHQPKASAILALRPTTLRCVFLRRSSCIFFSPRWVLWCTCWTRWVAKSVGRMTRPSGVLNHSSLSL